MPVYFGDTLYKGKVVDYDQKNLFVKLEKVSYSSSFVTVSYDEVGKKLFFRKRDVNLSESERDLKPEYFIFKYQNMLGTKKYEENLRKHLINYLTHDFAFKGFCHYTDFSNLINIFKTGYLLSRNNLVYEDFYESWNEDIIKHSNKKFSDFVHLFYRVKTPYLYVNEGVKLTQKKPHMPTPVLLIFNEDIIFQDNVVFANGSCNNYQTVITQDLITASSFNWPIIFSTGPIPNIYNYSSSGFGDISFKSITNYRNAEFMYPQKLNLHYLKKVVFRSKADYKNAITLFGERSIFQVDTKNECFFFLQNFLYDYKVFLDKLMLNIYLEFFRDDFMSYKHKLILYMQNRKQVIDLFIDQSNDLIINRLQQGLNISFSCYERVVKVEYYFHESLSLIWLSKQNN